MKKDILDFVLCPYCKKNNLKLVKQSKNVLDIREGQLMCQNCKNIFSIHHGIIYLHKEFDKIVQKEQEAHRQMNKNKNSLRLSEIEVERSALATKNTKSFLKHLKSSWVEEKRIIELGAGACWLISGLAKDNYCVALDINVSPINGLRAADILIKENNSVFFERISADMKSLPFENNSFDVVLISAALHHSSDLTKTLKEIYRILALKGQLVLINEPVIGCFGGSGRKMAIRFRKMGFNEEMYSIQEWIWAFKEVGFGYKIYLPDNILDIIKLKGKIFKILSNILRLAPLFIKKNIISLITKPSLVIFDGCFNAILYKK